MVYDPRNVTAVCDEVEPITPAQRDAARRTVAHFAADTQDAVELMMMLGIHPSQDDDEPVSPGRRRPKTC